MKNYRSLKIICFGLGLVLLAADGFSQSHAGGDIEKIKYTPIVFPTRSHIYDINERGEAVVSYPDRTGLFLVQTRDGRGTPILSESQMRYLR